MSRNVGLLLEEGGGKIAPCESPSVASCVAAVAYDMCGGAARDLPADWPDYRRDDESLRRVPKERRHFFRWLRRERVGQAGIKRQPSEDIRTDAEPGRRKEKAPPPSRVGTELT